MSAQRAQSTSQPDALFEATKTPPRPADDAPAPAAVTAAEVKDALRRRHPGSITGGMVGQWTCIEEWCEIDLLAVSAWRDAAVVGYEVKVSRSDLRQELLHPRKRSAAVAMCTEFYFAVPRGMLKPEEIAYEEPDWQPDDFDRTRCPGVPVFGPVEKYVRRRRDTSEETGRYGGRCHGHGWAGSYKAGTREKGPFRTRMPVPLVAPDPPEYITTRWQRVEDTPNEHGNYHTERVSLAGDELRDALSEWAHGRAVEAERSVLCPACGGKGYAAKSRVEVEAPTLWVPKDVGLVEVDGRGCRVVRKSPRRPAAPGLAPGPEASTKAQRQAINQLVRWVSNRPDPRHVSTNVHTEEIADAA